MQKFTNTLLLHVNDSVENFCSKVGGHHGLVQSSVMMISLMTLPVTQTLTVLGRAIHP